MKSTGELLMIKLLRKKYYGRIIAPWYSMSLVLMLFIIAIFLSKTFKGMDILQVLQKSY